MALVLTINAVNRTSILMDNSLVVEQQAANFISICTLTLIDEDGNIAISAEDDISVVDGATTFFAGRVVDTRYTLFTTASRYIHISCQDLNAQLGETVIDVEAVFTAEDDAVIIDTLFDDFLPAVDSETHVDTIQDPLTITFPVGTMLRSALSQICTRTGGYFYVGFDNKLHYFEAETSGVAWWLTGDPNRDAAATNLIKNPSIEIDTTGWIGFGAAVSRDTAYAKFGTASLKVITDNAGAIEGTYIDVAGETAINTEYTFSCYLRGSGTVRLLIWDVTGGDQYGPVITLTSEWARHEWTATLSTGIQRAVAVYANVQQDITFYCDGFQLEAHEHGSSYFDGSFGADFDWTGAANASTSTRGAGAASYFDTGINKTSLAITRLDGVYVIGDGVEGWRGTHAPGDRQGVARDNRIKTATGRNERGDAVLARYGSAQVTYTVATYTAGLKAGMDILFICLLYNVNATFTVRRMLVKWDKAKVAYYTLTLGDVVNPSLITERNWLDTLPQALGPITAPRLPTSSRGWSHDIVFSATDFDTVAWAAAGDITLADGSVYTIDAGNTGNMGAITYIYLDLDTSVTVLQTTGAAATAVGSNKLLIAVAAPVADEDTNKATLQVFGGEGIGVMITGDNIVAETITGNEINANAIAAGHIVAGAIETDKLDALAVTAAKIAANTITADKIDMGLGAALFNAADGLLLLGPHCGISPTEWWSLRKQGATLSGAFHQEAGRWLGTRGLVVEEATTNLVKNPSIETNTTSWTADDTTISRDTTYAAFGAAALKVITDNAAANEGIYSVVTGETAINTEYTFSVYLRGSGTVFLRVFDPGAGFQNGSTITLTDVWTRHEFTFTYGAGADRRVDVYTTVQQNITFYCDGFQLEEQDYATTYCDGSLGTGYAWTGAAHASTSTRAVTEVNLDAHVGLLYNNVAWSVALWVQMPFDYDDWPTDGHFFSLFEDGNNFMDLWLETGNDRISLRYKETVAVTINEPLAFSAGDWVHLVANIDTAGDLELIVNGVLGATADISARAVIQPTEMNLGALRTGASSNAVHAELALFDRVLTVVEAAGIYALQRPMIDMGSLDRPGIYILDGQFKIASSTTGNRIEITADEIAGYDSGGTKQFYLQASDGVAVAGAGAVTLDEDGLTLTTVDADPSRVKWGAGPFAQISAYQAANTHYMWLKVFATGESDENAVIFLEALGEGGHDDAEFGVVAEDDDTFAQVYAKVGGVLNLQVAVDALAIGAANIRSVFGGPIVVGSGNGDYAGAGIADGMLWYRNDTDQLRLRVDGSWVTINTI